MFHGDRSRKDTLIDYGFRLPCARDNRPLTPDEFFERVGKVVFVSATPGDWELSVSENVVEQIIRPTGLVDPVVEIRPIQGQIDDLIGEIKERSQKDERVLVTTLTKRMAEDLTDYLSELGIKVKWLHSDIKAIERVELLRDLRQGVFDVLVGVNLLREGLDLPEVSLVAIMEADKEGFLRAERSLIQTIGRAARNAEGKVILYADKMTDSIVKAKGETERRRALQMAHNQEHGIVPRTIVKHSSNILLDTLRGKSEEIELEQANVKRKRKEKGGKVNRPEPIPEAVLELSQRDLLLAIKRIEKEMKDAARELDFERAADLRDQLKVLHERAQQLRKPGNN
ncbi:MAG: UvrABC system protein B [bacterium ADurb.Bin425]|nr:MAG: UvrABC system protein B [bacterium ADurb.Bin425]